MTLRGDSVTVSVEGTNCCRTCGDHLYWAELRIYDASGTLLWSNRTRSLSVGGDLGRNGWARASYATTLPADVAERAASAVMEGREWSGVEFTQPDSWIPITRIERL